MGTQQVMRVVVDTNVVVSALLFGGTLGRLIPLWKERRITPVVSAPIAAEYLRVLAYPRFGLAESEIHYLIHREILPYCDVIDVDPGPVVVKDDPADDAFLYCAAAARARFVISGDGHLLALKAFGGIPIVSPAEFFDVLKV